MAAATRESNQDQATPPQALLVLATSSDIIPEPLRLLDMRRTLAALMLLIIPALFNVAG